MDIKKSLRENLQLADKTYFRSGKLSDEARQIILKITNGDPFTKIIADIYASFISQTPDNDVLSNSHIATLKDCYIALKNYNSNIFPIKGYNINGVEDISGLISALKFRAKILDSMRSLPKVAFRSIQKDVRLERDSRAMQNFEDDLSYFTVLYSSISNRDEELRVKINNKIFRGDSTLKDWVNFADEKENLLGGQEFTKEMVNSLIKENYYLEKIYSKGDIMIVEVTDFHGIKELGCNSLWCFTYSNKGGYNRDWDTYSTNGYVYVIIDFSQSSDSSDFMHVLIKPLIDSNVNDVSDDEDDYEDDEEILYTMDNNPVYDANTTISRYMDIWIAKRLMNFDLDYEKPPRKPKTKFVDPNQMSLAFEGRNNIKKMLTEQLTNVDEDVNMLYDKYFRADMDIVRETRFIDRSLFRESELSTSDLTSPLCVRANELNPCKISINGIAYRSTPNAYSPIRRVIMLSAQFAAVDYILNQCGGSLDDAIDGLVGDVKIRILNEFSEHRIKGTIHHELAHWIDDTMNNQHIEKKIKNKNFRTYAKQINKEPLEVQGQIHNIYQAKKEHGDIWDLITFKDLTNYIPSLNAVLTGLTDDNKKIWLKALKKRMFREKLLGDNMY